MRGERPEKRKGSQPAGLAGLFVLDLLFEANLQDYCMSLTCLHAGTHCRITGHAVRSCRRGQVNVLVLIAGNGHGKCEAHS